MVWQLPQADQAVIKFQAGEQEFLQISGRLPLMAVPMELLDVFTKKGKRLEICPEGHTINIGRFLWKTCPQPPRLTNMSFCENVLFNLQTGIFLVQEKTQGEGNYQRCFQLKKFELKKNITWIAENSRTWCKARCVFFVFEGGWVSPFSRGSSLWKMEDFLTDLFRLHFMAKFWIKSDSLSLHITCWRWVIYDIMTISCEKSFAVLETQLIHFSL